MKKSKFLKTLSIIGCALVCSALFIVKFSSSPVSALSYDFKEITESLRLVPEGESMTVTNNVFIFQFQDETNNLNDNVSGYDETSYTVREVIENGYKDSLDGGSEYSLSSYYRTISNGRLNVENKFIYASTANGVYEPFVINLGRASTIAQPSGYTALFNQIFSYVVPYLQTIDYDTDANDDGYVDALSFIFIPSTIEVTTNDSCMWPHKWSSSIFYSSQVSINGESLYLGNYQLMTAEVFLGDRTYIEDSNGVKILDVATNIHEFGHVLGFPDLYCYGGTNSVSETELVPVGIWDVMAGNYYKSAQQMLSYNAIEAGFLLESNRQEITSNGTYTLYPLSTAASSSDIASYYIQGTGEYADQYFYIEYRTGGLYDGLIYNDGLIVYRVDEALTSTRGGTDQSVTIGNYSAPPCVIEVMRNDLTVSASDKTYLNYAAAFLGQEDGGRFTYIPDSSSTNSTLENFLAPISSIPSTRTNGDFMGIDKIGYSTAPSSQDITYNFYGYESTYTLTTGAITYQDYNTNLAQGSISPSSVQYVNTGIEIEVVSTNGDGSITFSVNWDEFGTDQALSESSFADKNLYDALIDIVSSFKGQQVSALYSSDLNGLTSLDLSGKNISSFVDIAKFDLSTIEYIDLSNNLISSFYNLLSSATSLIKLNLNLNDLTLSSISSSIRNDTRVIWGIQRCVAEEKIYFYHDAQQTLLTYFFSSSSDFTSSYDFTIGQVVTITTRSAPGTYYLDLNFNSSYGFSPASINFTLARLTLTNTTLERNSSFTPAVTFEGISSSGYTVSASAVDTSSVGQKTVTIYVYSGQTLVTSFIQALTIEDTTSPTIALDVSGRVTLYDGETFDITDHIVSVTDNGEPLNYEIVYRALTSNDTSRLSIMHYRLNQGSYQLISAPTTWTEGEYRVLLEVVDASGNRSAQLSLLITVTVKGVILEATQGETVWLDGSQSGFDISQYYSLYIDGEEITNISRKYTALTSLDRNMLSIVSSYRKTGNSVSLSSLPTELGATTQYVFVLQAVDSSGQMSDELTLTINVRALNSILKSSFGNDSLYDALCQAFLNRFDTSLFPLYRDMLVEYYNGAVVDLSNLGLTSLMGLDEFSFNSTMVLDVSSNSLSSISQSLLNILNQNVNVVALFNNILMSSKPSNLYLGVQNIKEFYLNEAPESGFRNYADQGSFLTYTLTSNVSTASSSLAPGTYTLNYTNSSYNLSRSYTFTYATIILEHGKTRTIEAGRAYSSDNVLFAGVDSADYTVLENTGNINLSRVTIGDYAVTYTVMQGDETILTLRQTVACRDTIAPTLQYSGNTTMYVYYYDIFSDPGMVVSDTYDSAPTLNRRVYFDGELVSGVDTSKIGQYTIEYFATDASGNTSQVRNRTVNIIYHPVQTVSVSLREHQVVKVGDSIELLVTKSNLYNRVDPEAVIRLYVDGEYVGEYVGDAISYAFESVGEHEVYVEVSSMSAEGYEEIAMSSVLTVNVIEKSFLENYGLIIIASGAGLLIVALIAYFIIRKKRSMF